MSKQMQARESEDMVVVVVQGDLAVKVVLGVV